MQTTKKWVKTGKFNFSFQDNNQEIGTMEIASGTMERKAIAKFEEQTIVIKKTGLWKNILELTDTKGQIIAKAFHEKWYANSLILEYNNKKYKLLIRNNPLAEWVIQYNNEDLLAYGLSTKTGKAYIRITTITDKADYLLDFILWYLFVPIAAEQGADDFTFLALLCAQ